MTTSANPLRTIWETYSITKDCIRVTSRVHKRQDFRLLTNTEFVLLEESEAQVLTKKCQEDAEAYAIIAFWAVFERFLINYLQEKWARVEDEPPEAFSIPFAEKLEVAIEYWRPDEILDLFKGIVDPRLIGMAKQIKKYRDWLAHKNERRGHDGKTDPRMAYEVLSDIIRSIGNAQ